MLWIGPFVLPLLFKGFSNVLIKAMACSGACVCRRGLPGMAVRILRDETLGVLVSSNDQWVLEPAMSDGFSGAGTDANPHALEFTVERGANAHLELSRDLLIAACERGRV